jgi:hypothetical protein
VLIDPSAGEGKEFNVKESTIFYREIKEQAPDLVVGFAGGLAVCVGAMWFVTILMRLWPNRPSLAVALAIVPLHNMADFSLYTSGVAIPWAILLGWGLAETKSSAEPPSGRWTRVLLVTASAGVVALTMLHATSVILERAAFATIESTRRFDDAAQAYRLAPWRMSAVSLAAAAAVESGDPIQVDEASRLITKAQRWRPRSAVLAEARGRLDLAVGNVPTGVAGLWEAARAQPAVEERKRTLNRLLGQLEVEGQRARR